MAWSAQGSKGPPFSIIHSFYKQRVFVVFQRFQGTTILHRAIMVVGEASSRLGVLGFLPISLNDLFCATSDGFRS
jgi:hypothetical protein